MVARGHQGAGHDEHGALRNRRRGRSASSGARRSMMRSAADFESPNNGASWPASSSCASTPRPAGHGSPGEGSTARPRRAASAPSRRRAVTSLPKQRGLSPVNGPIQDGCDAVITAATSRSSHYPRTQRYEDQYSPNSVGRSRHLPVRCGATQDQGG
jgi:hypothetical protein